MACFSPMVQGITQWKSFITVAPLPVSGPSSDDCLIGNSKMKIMLGNTQICSNSDKGLGHEWQNVSRALDSGVSLVQWVIGSELLVLILCSPNDNRTSRILDKKRA